MLPVSSTVDPPVVPPSADFSVEPPAVVPLELVSPDSVVLPSLVDPPVPLVVAVVEDVSCAADSLGAVEPDVEVPGVVDPEVGEDEVVAADEPGVVAAVVGEDEVVAADEPEVVAAVVGVVAAVVTSVVTLVVGVGTGAAALVVTGAAGVDTTSGSWVTTGAGVSSVTTGAWGTMGAGGAGATVGISTTGGASSVATVSVGTNSVSVTTVVSSPWARAGNTPAPIAVDETATTEASASARRARRI